MILCYIIYTKKHTYFLSSIFIDSNGVSCTCFAGFGGAATATSGTTVKFTPPAGTETMLKGGNQQNMNTRHQCITAMKEYEAKSLEVSKPELEFILFHV